MKGGERMGPRWGPCRGRSSSMPAAPAARLQCTASRQLELRQLPPVLCFSLQRFVFDFQVGPGWGVARLGGERE